MKNRGAIGIVRVSEVNGRDGDSFASPNVQRERISDVCRDGLQLIETHDELDVSGGKPLEDRPGLSRAVAAIEAGQADVVVAAYFDRLFRSLRIQAEVIERVETAGGQVLAVDVGQVTNGTAAQWLSGTMHGAMSEYFRRHVGEKSGEAVARAVERGVAPWPRVPPGYRRRADGVLEPDSTASVVAEAFRIRASGATVTDVRSYLSANGVKRSYHGVLALMSSRVVLGEVHFGKLVNLHAHEPIVDREIWHRVQTMAVPRGPKPKSDRLLARLGVLRCGMCGSRMVVGSSNHRQYAIYRCPPTGACTRRVTISADKVETFVVDEVKRRHAGIVETVSAQAHVRKAAGDAERARTNYEAAMEALKDFTDAAAVRRLRDLKADWEAAEASYAEASDDLDAASLALSLDDWDELSFDGQRKLIKASISQVRVSPGRAADRIHIEWKGS